MSTAQQQAVRRMYAAGADNYDRVRLQEDRGTLLTNHDLAIFESLLPDASPGAVALEAGAGTGRFTLAALGRAHFVVATDVNDGMLDLLRSKIAAAGLDDRCLVQEEDIFRLSFPDAHFNFAFSIHVVPRFLCLEDQAAAIREIARTLKPGGRLLFNYRNSKSFYSAAYQGHAASPAQIRAILGDCGLRIVRARGKWLLNRRVLNLVPMPAARLLARVDRVLRAFWPGRAWDVFILAEKHRSA